MKKILIPIGFKLNSYDAIDYAIHFFKKEYCDFYFLNTYTYNVDGLDALNILQADDDRFERSKLDSEEVLGHAIKKYTLSNQNKKHCFNAISECIGLIDGIKKTIRENNIDLVIIVGKKKSKDIAHKYSQNTKRIIDSIRECPVMVISQSLQIQKNPEFVSETPQFKTRHI